MLIPLVVLAVLSVIGGFFGGVPAYLVNLVTGGNSVGTAFSQFLAPSLGGEAAGAAPVLDLTTQVILTLASVGMAAAGVLVAAAMYLVGRLSPAAVARALPALYDLLLNKWYVDELYQALIAHPGARLAAFLAAFDLGVIDGMVNGVARLAKSTGGLLRRLQSGYVRGYAVTMLIGVFCVLAYWVIRG
jgi:NADH-quinone oxidoreductase subunit L